MPGLHDLSRAVTSLVAALGIAALKPLAGIAQGTASERWVVCYNDSPAPFSLAAYDVVVLDPDNHPSLEPSTSRGRTVLAYLSLTQIGRGRRTYESLQAAGIVIEAHPSWEGAYYLDFRRPEWTRTVLEDLVPRALDMGFTGLFLDTLDDAEFLETREPGRYAGMRDAAVALVRAIRHHYPDIVLMVNRGYALMPRIASEVDILLGESVLSTFDAETKSYRRVSPADAEWQMAALRRARAANPSLRLFTLDYWDEADPAGVRWLYQNQRANGFAPYVSTFMLDRVVKEPQ
jgi:uncharacterized protein (TIGR01370 family)